MSLYFNILEIIKHKPKNGNSVGGKISYMVHSYLPGTSISYARLLIIAIIVIVLAIIVAMLLRHKSKAPVIKQGAQVQEAQPLNTRDHMNLF